MTLHTRCTGNTARMFQCCFKNSIMLFHWLFNCFLFYATVSSCVMKTVFEPLGWTRHMALILVEHINFQQPFQKTERRRLWGNAFSESNPPLVQRFRSKKWFPPAATLPFGMIIYTYIYIYTHSMLWPFWLLSCVCLTPSFSVAFSVLLCPSLSLSSPPLPSPAQRPVAITRLRVLRWCSTAAARFRDNLSVAFSLFAYLLFQFPLRYESCNSAVPTSSPLDAFQIHILGGKLIWGIQMRYGAVTNHSYLINGAKMWRKCELQVHNKCSSANLTHFFATHQRAKLGETVMLFTPRLKG